MTRFLMIALFLLAGCAQLPPPPEDATAKRFEPVPGKAVIYLARPALDPSFIAPVVLDEQPIGSTYRGTYIRIEVPAGNHVLRGMGGDSGSIKLDTQAGQIYFVLHNAYGHRSFNSSAFSQVGAGYGRSLVLNGQITAVITQ